MPLFFHQCFDSGNAFVGVALGAEFGAATFPLAFKDLRFFGGFTRGLVVRQFLPRLRQFFPHSRNLGIDRRGGVEFLESRRSDRLPCGLPAISCGPSGFSYSDAGNHLEHRAVFGDTGQFGILGFVKVESGAWALAFVRNVTDASCHPTCARAACDYFAGANSRLFKIEPGRNATAVALRRGLGRVLKYGTCSTSFATFRLRRLGALAEWEAARHHRHPRQRLAGAEAATSSASACSGPWCSAWRFVQHRLGSDLPGRAWPTC